MMKHNKFSRFLALGVAAALSVGCISLNAFAGEFSSGAEEAVVVEEPAVDGMNLFGDGAVLEGNDTDGAPVEGVLENDDVTGELFQDGTGAGTTDVVFGDTAGELFSDETEPASQAAIILNYGEFVFNAVGESVLLAATVSGVEPVVVEAPVEEVAQEEVLAEEEADVEFFAVSEDVEAPVEETPVAEAASEAPAANAVLWASSDEAVVTVDANGLVCAVGGGEAIITCTLAADQNVTATCKVTVNGACETPEHVHEIECLVRELVCDHVSEEEHTADCFQNSWGCGMEEHVHNEECFEEATDVVSEEEVDFETFTSN